MQNVNHSSTKHQFLTKTAAKLAHACGATLFSMSFYTLQVVCQQHFSFLWAIYMHKFIWKWKTVVPKEINQVQFTFTTGQFKTAKKYEIYDISAPPPKTTLCIFTFVPPPARLLKLPLAECSSFWCCLVAWSSAPFWFVVQVKIELTST